MTMLNLVRITIDRGNPPFSQELYGELQGVSVDLIRRAFASQHVEVEFDPVDGPMAQAIHLSAGRADAAADMTVTERRQRWFRFSHRYYVEELQVYTSRHGQVWTGWAHFHGKIAVKTDSYAYDYLVRHHPQTALLPVDTTERLLDVLAAGRAQAVVMTRVTGATLLAEDQSHDLVASGAPFGPAPLALAALPERQDVLDIFNAGLAVAGDEAELLSPFRPH